MSSLNSSSSRPQANVMLSRVAHSLYWMSRYIERAENLSRLLDVNIRFLLDFRDFSDDRMRLHWDAVLAGSGDMALFAGLYENATSDCVISFLALDRRNPNSIVSCVAAARENARMILDQISLEMWEALNELHLQLRDMCVANPGVDDASDFLAAVRRGAALFRGITETAYDRNEGWEFIRFGQYVERADKITRILDVKYYVLLPNASDVCGAVDTAQWQSVLRSAGALEAYRRFYVREILPWKVAELLVFSESFPRALHHCVAGVDDSVRRIFGETTNRTKHPAVRTASRLLAELRSLTIEEVMASGLHEFFEEVRKSLDRISEEVVQTTMFYSAEVTPEARRHQQQQQQQ